MSQEYKVKLIIISGLCARQTATRINLNNIPIHVICNMKKVSVADPDVDRVIRKEHKVPKANTNLNIV